MPRILSDFIIRQIKLFILLSCVNIVHYDIVISSSEYNPSTLCEKDDFIDPQTTPMFMEKRVICNFDTVPVLVYQIKVVPLDDKSIFPCLQGEFAENTFNITKDNEIKLFVRLEQSEISLRLLLIKISADDGTAKDNRAAVNEIQFTLIIKDCNQITWQTILVAVLTSICVVLSAVVAIMLILYQQRGLIKVDDDDDSSEDVAYHDSKYHPATDETFINPRRTSSYEYGTISKQYQAQTAASSSVKSEIPLVSMGAAQETYPGNSPQIRSDRLSSTMPILSEITENINEVDETRFDGGQPADHVNDIDDNGNKRQPDVEYDNEGFVCDR